MFDLIEYHKLLRRNKIMLIYSGPLWAEGIGGVANTIKKRLEYDDLPLETSQEVFSVFVEQVNNMLMYSEEREQFDIEEAHSDAPKGTFVMGTHEDKYFIQTGNLIKNENVEYLKEKIDYLNSLDKDELRKYYKEQRMAEDRPGSKGAGLGLIEIARRVSSKIEYTFTPDEEGYSFFTLYAMIGGN